MPRGDDRSLKSARLDSVAVFDADTSVAEALVDSVEADDSWLLVVQRNGMPIAVMSPGWTKSLARTDPGVPMWTNIFRSPPFLIAPSTTTYASVLEQAADFELDPRTPLLVFEDGQAVGVSTVARLESDLFHIRLGGTTLPGKPTIPVLIRKCEYREPNAQCIFVSQFQTKPTVMPPCPNPMNLQPHNFVW